MPRSRRRPRAVLELHAGCAKHPDVRWVARCDRCARRCCDRCHLGPRVADLCVDCALCVAGVRFRWPRRVPAARAA